MSSIIRDVFAAAAPEHVRKGFCKVYMLESSTIVGWHVLCRAGMIASRTRPCLRFRAPCQKVRCMVFLRYQMFFAAARVPRVAGYLILNDNSSKWTVCKSPW